jgi:hypothetical protein
MNETTIEAIYSILAWPKGCSLSAGLDESLKLISVITDVPESQRLLSASATIATDPDITPAKILIPARIILTIIPTMLERVP